MSKRFSTWKWPIAALALWVVCEASAAATGYHFGKLECVNLLKGYEGAIEECADDLRKNCRGLLEYAGTLEDENGKLHMKIKKLEKEVDAR
jgi:hypothetical protein